MFRLTAPKLFRPSLSLALLAVLSTATWQVPHALAQSAPAALKYVASVQPCKVLLTVDMTVIGGPGSKITEAKETTARGAPVCLVSGVLSPSIGFQVELPKQTWSQRFMQLGCGGLCGRVSLQVGAADGCPTFAAGGFVLASTDMGHQGMGVEWGKDPQKRADFAYRSVHVTAEAVKALIRRYYGQAERFSYFNGCSDGGREALIEAQRFPNDFNGIIAGAPAMNFQVQNSLYHGWQARANTGADGKPILLAGRLPILHAAVLKACDALDGQVDGLISTPGLCHFDLATVRCRPGQNVETCLTSAEVVVARKFYEGPRDPKTGKRLTVGGPLFGSELAWGGIYVPQDANQPIFSAMIAMQAMQHLTFDQDPPADFKLSDLHFDRATFDRLRVRHPLFDATNPDLSGFVARGGKLILWQGWADPHISPVNTIAYHDAIRGQMGSAQASEFERLYLLPGVYHCSGGEGPSLIDLVTPMLAWVENGTAPDAIVARQADPHQVEDFGQPAGRTGEHSPNIADKGLLPLRLKAVSTVPFHTRSRPVYPYPFVAAYDGRGDVDQASSYIRGAPLARLTPPPWVGSDFYASYAPRVQ